MTRGAAPQQVVVPANAAVTLPYLRPHPEQRALPAAHLRCPVRASRRIAASPVLHPSFETLAPQAPKDEDRSYSIFKQQPIPETTSPWHRQAPEVLLLTSALLQSEGAGNAGRRCAQGKKCIIVTTVTPETPGIPRAMVLRLTSCSPAIGLFCHRHRRNCFHRPLNGSKRDRRRKGAREFQTSLFGLRGVLSLSFLWCSCAAFAREGLQGPHPPGIRVRDPEARRHAGAVTE
jgi:hypothetical protein